MALLILALLQRIFLMSSLMLLLVWLIFFMVLIKLLPILGTISGKTVKLMVLALIYMQRYHDVISSFGGKTSYDADNRLLLVMRSNLWASGYDVDGTDQTSLGQFSGRVQQTYKHSVPRFFVP